MNLKRREVDEATTEQAFAQLEQSDPDAFCTVVSGKDWHRGVVGIVASRLIEKRYRPSIVLSEEDGMLIGSARSVDGVDIHNALEKCSELLHQFGGHTMAAGLSLKVENLELFKERLEIAMKEQLNNEPPQPKVHCDQEVKLGDLTLEAFRELQQLEPFGPGNPTPLFILKNVQCLRAPRTIGSQGKHLKITIGHPESDHPSIDAIGWNMGHKAADIKKWTHLDLAFTLVKNTWKPRGWENRTELNLHLRSVRESGKRQED